MTLLARLLPILLPTVVALGCSAVPAPGRADPLGPQQIIASFTATIWPAIAAYHNSQTQTSPGSVALSRVIDPELRGDERGALRAAAGGLGRNSPSDYDSATRTSHSSLGLQLGGVTVTSADSHTATLDVCYTYTHFWDQQVNNTQQAPGASQALVGLTNADGTWTLHNITDDHVVPGCPANTG